MRGADVMQEELFTVGGLDQYIPVEHPLRRVRDLFNYCLCRMDTHFNELYSPFGRDSIAPEKLLRALMLQVLFGGDDQNFVCKAGEQTDSKKHSTRAIE